ncbi:hypothetical protein LMG28690_00797 [Paraburkholderia caffeinilytica]|nr:hypothetical protein LMG28690_00797 [Paraburkholderia caffeinilytica]
MSCECGDFCLSEAIRTLTVSAPSPSNTHRVRLGVGVGGGVVLDSHANDECAETLFKAKFLTVAEPMAWVS